MRQHKSLMPSMFYVCASSVTKSLQLRGRACTALQTGARRGITLRFPEQRCTLFLKVPMGNDYMPVPIPPTCISPMIMINPGVNWKGFRLCPHGIHGDYRAIATKRTYEASAVLQND